MDFPQAVVCIGTSNQEEQLCTPEHTEAQRDATERTDKVFAKKATRDDQEIL